MILTENINKIYIIITLKLLLLLLKPTIINTIKITTNQQIKKK